VDNYVCDVARTAVAGDPAAEHEAIWQKLVDCWTLALEMIRPGASSRRIFQVYIEKMDAWGLPTLHFLGHGLGLTLHEEPYLHRYGDTTLEEGMVLAVEPLVTFPALGMQLEDAVVVTGGHGQQGAGPIRRLNFESVEPRAGDPALAQGGAERLLVHQPPARRIHEDGVGLHRAQPVSVH